ncbi:MAG: Rap1a/Tai family immunity protein [Acetobacteraceae bacterium]
MRLRISIFGILLAVVFLLPHAQAAVSRDNFLLRNTGDLTALCSAGESDPLATAARNFCEGFTVGVVRVLQKVMAAEAPRPAMFCLPAQGPTRSAGIASFVRWANAEPGRLALPAEDGLATFLKVQFPCPPGK